MADQSMMDQQHDQAYGKQIELLTQKIKEYRSKSKELEGLLLDNENKRLDMRKQIEELAMSENEQ
jgi:Trp operon repressor